MRSPFIILLLLLGVGLGGSSLRELRTLLLESNYRAMEPEAQLTQAGIDLAQRLASSAEPSSKGWVLLSDAYRRQALKAEGQARLEGLCLALSSLGRAIHLRHRASRYLVNWANLRQLLGSYQCSQDYTNGSFRGAVSEARRLDPTQPAVAYAGGLILSWAGDSSAASQSFQQFLRLSIAPNPSQLDFIVRYLAQRLVQSEATAKKEAVLANTVPARFPQVVVLGNLLMDRYPEVLRAHSAALVELFERALKLSQGEYDSQQLRADLHRRNVESGLAFLEQLPSEAGFRKIGDLAPSGQVLESTRGDLRRVLDQMAAQVIQQTTAEAEKNSVARYFGRRAQARELKITRGQLAADTRPVKGQLFSWGSSLSIALDNFHQSVGFRLADQQSLDWIEIGVPALANAQQLSTSLSVWSSLDNETWRPVALAEAPEIVRFGEMQWLLLAPEQHEAPFWKVNFKGAERSRLAEFPLDRLLRGYGRSLYLD